MHLNADFSRPALVKFEQNTWIASPTAGVERKMLDRIGEEVARATTIVRYAPGSAFSAHTHDGGEEYLVLDGVFCDEHGSFPIGSYVRNPPTSHHSPAAPDGAMIFVKLHQFEPADRTGIHRVVDPDAGSVSPERPNVRRQELYCDHSEAVRVEWWKPNADVEIDAPGGLEALVLDGTFTQNGEELGKWDWLRLPVRSRLAATAGSRGTQVWLKTGHLRNLKPDP